MKEKVDKIVVGSEIKCPKCKGRGYYHSKSWQVYVCEKCIGKGKIILKP